MGLDMYLYRQERTAPKTISSEEVCYWRKANMIHRYFIDALELPEDFNGEWDAEVPERVIVELCERIEMILEDHGKAEDLLPTSPGFFFGSTDYEEWYFEDLETTLEELRRILKETDFDKQWIVYSCWW